jgi:hypothetical protein
VHRHSMPYFNENPIGVRPESTTSPELDAGYPNAPQQSNASSVFSQFTSSEIWNFPVTNQSQIWNETPNLGLRSFSTPEVGSGNPYLTTARNSSPMSSTITTSRQ